MSLSEISSLLEDISEDIENMKNIPASERGTLKQGVYALQNNIEDAMERYGDCSDEDEYEDSENDEY